MSTMIDGTTNGAEIAVAEGRLPKASPGRSQEGRLPKASPDSAGARGAALPGPQWSAGESSAGERSETKRNEPERNVGPGNADRGGEPPPASPAPAPDNQVLERPKRRFFSAEYKRSILRRADRCAKGELGALLRSEGLYSSHLTVWRRERDAALDSALVPKKRGPKVPEPNPLATELAQVRREKALLERRLKRVELMLEIQKKASELLGIPLNSPKLDEED